MIGYRGHGFEQDTQTEENFIEICKYWDIEFILPNKV